MTTDPWTSISKPAGPDLSARRADPDHPHDFFWARDLEGHCLLVFEYDAAIEVRDRRPSLKEIRILEPRIPGDPGRFVLQLSHSENREIFHQLCLDIIQSTQECKDQKSALATLIRRAWRWHGMLRGGRDDRLSPQEQKGLIGELRVLELALLPRFSAADAMEFWRGPENAPKDFSIGGISIEAKAKRGASRSYVDISSEYQLDTEGLKNLFLAVSYVDEGAASSADALTLTEYVTHIQNIVETADSGAVGFFESRLEEAGFSYEHDYSDRHWVVGRTRWFRVDGKFPRIYPAALPEGVQKVNYTLDLSGCSGWEVELDDVTGSLSGEKS